MLAGVVYRPDGTSGRLPAIIVGRQTTGVKEQSPNVYASRLVGHRFLMPTFDAAYRGDSEGRPRGLEDPRQRAEDFRNAVSYLTTPDDVDEQRIGVMGHLRIGQLRALRRADCREAHRISWLMPRMVTPVRVRGRWLDPAGNVT